MPINYRTIRLDIYTEKEKYISQAGTVFDTCQVSCQVFGADLVNIFHGRY